jgi:uncharacterized protein (TIGR00266 family)
MNTWRIAINGQAKGPYSAEEISRYLALGRIGPDTPAWKEGMTDWASISRIPELNPDTQQPGMGPPPLTPGMAHGINAHEIDYQIFGQEMQFVEIELDPGESAVAEAGAMMYMTDGIVMETIFGDGSTSSQTGGFFDRLIGAGKRLITGESLFCTVFTQQGHGKARVAFGAPYPGKIIPLDLKNYDNEITCQKDAFLCAAKGVSIGLAFQKKIGVALFGREGFIMQKLEGDGLSFIHAGGTIVEKQLGPGETLRVDTGCLVALTRTVSYDIEYIGNVKSAIFGGEGFFFANLTGPGHLWLQSLPFSRLAGKIHESAPQNTRGSSTKGEGSMLEGLGNLFQD